MTAPVDPGEKAALVTGAGRGIGRATALALSKAGMRIAIAARTVAELHEVAALCSGEGREAVAIPTDLTDQTQCTHLLDSAVASLGRIDVLVNNAGIGYFEDVEKMSVSHFDQMWNVNLRAVFLLSKAVIPVMERQGGGVIINIGSLAGKNPVRGGAGYAATKWALRGFSSSLMLEVRDRNIRVTTIFPGSVDTSFSTKNQRGKRITQPEDVASAVLFAATMQSRAMVSEIDVRPTRP